LYCFVLMQNKIAAERRLVKSNLSDQPLRLLIEI